MKSTINIIQQCTLPFLWEKCGMSFSKSCWGVTVASINLHKAMLAFSLTLSLVSPSLTYIDWKVVSLIHFYRPSISTTSTIQIRIFTCRLCWLGRCWGKAWNRTLVGLSGTQWCLAHSGIPDIRNSIFNIKYGKKQSKRNAVKEKLMLMMSENLEVWWLHPWH